MSYAWPAYSVSEKWYTIDDVVRLTGWSLRTARDKLADCGRDFRRIVRQERGRPSIEYRAEAHPTLLGAVLTIEQGIQDSQFLNSAGKAITKDDLAGGALRAQAVIEYLARLEEMPEAAAAAVTCAHWARNPKTYTFTVSERIGKHIRPISKSIRVGGFKERSLREWAKTYRAAKTPQQAIYDLAPARKGKSGRPRKEVDETVLDFIAGKAISTCRADITKAFEMARQFWPQLVGDISYDTVRRRIREADPQRSNDVLGKSGIPMFRRNISPDIERDYRLLGFNEEFQLDDFRMDWYAHAADIEKILRPYCYAIIRISTRQWIFGVTAETPITQDQVRSMVGMCLADPACGIPDVLKFERGELACDEYLEESLNALGIRVGRTSMDGGKVHPDAIPDSASGHYEGKPVVESNIRSLHNVMAFMPCQTGPEERHTMSARDQRLKELAVKAAKEGKPLMLPTANQMRESCFSAMDRYNNKPHGGLPETVDLDTGKQRNMSPNEYAQTLRDQAIRVMDEIYLPLFFEKSVKVKVTKNGILINKEYYGRFDAGLREHESVSVYALKECPDIVYVEELQRCLERYQKTAFSDANAQQQGKYRLEKKFKSQYEALIDKYKQAEGVIIEMSRAMPDPTPDRIKQRITSEVLSERLGGIAGAVAVHEADRKDAEDKFMVDEIIANVTDPTPRRRGILAEADEIMAETAVLTGAKHDPFSI